MRRILMDLVLSLMLCLPLAAYADQACWRLQDNATPPKDLLDVLRCSYTPKGDTNPVIFELHCPLETPPLYIMGGGGIAVQDPNTPTQYALNIPLTGNVGGFFGGNKDCGFNASLDAVPGTPANPNPNYLNGTWSMQCAGGPVGPTSPFNVSGKLRFFACPVLSISRVAESLALQAAQMNALEEYRAAGCVPGQPCIPQLGD